MKKTDTFPVMGMHCAACAHNVERMLLTVDGVDHAAVNLAAATVSVGYDPDRATPEKMREAVGRAGFGLIIEDPDEAARQQEAAQRAYRRSLMRRCVMAWVWTVPLMALMFMAEGATMRWTALLLVLPVVAYSTLPFLTAAWRAARAGQTNMDTLVAVSTMIAFAFSLVGTLFPGVWTGRGMTPPCYYEATAMITAFVLTGKVMEERAKHRTGEAIRSLMGLQPRTARVVLPGGEEADRPIAVLAKGDRIRVLFEKKFADGTFVRDGRLLAVQIVHGDDVYEAVRFRGDESESFYTLDGQSSRQTFLRVPLEVQDVSSEYAPLRRHPVTGIVRSHNGTDFRAPSGTRIFAASNGVVTLRRYEARGYGRYIKIDHGLGRTTLYAHMSKVAPGIRVGARVKKGDVIGYVGATGLVTGPHLHYELMFNDVQVNPKTADLPDTENLSNYQLAQMHAQADVWLKAFDKFAEEEGESLPSVLKAEAKAREEEQQKAAQTEEAETAEEQAS